MNVWSLLPMMLCSLSALVVSACATATISNTVSVRPLRFNISDAPGISEAHLLGGGGMDWARKIICTQRGCALFGFTIKSFGETTDYFVAVEAPQGKIVWARTYGGTHRDALETAAPASDGGYLMVGSSQSLFFTPLKVISPSRPARPLLLRIDESGNVRWAATFDSGAVTGLLDAAQASDDGHILVGYGSSPGRNVELAAVKVSKDGEVLWANRYDIGMAAYGLRAATTPDGGVMIAGYTTTSDRKKPVDALGIKIDPNGTPVWARLYATEGWLAPLALVEDAGSGFLLAGASSETSGAENMFAMMVSPTGEPIWCRSYQAPRKNEALSMIRGYDGDFLVVGRIGDVTQGQQDGLVILLDRNGNVKADTIVKGQANTELISAVRWGESRYRLLGDTEGFGSAYVDILSLIWTPQTTGQLSPREITVRARAAQIAAVP